MAFVKLGHYRANLKNVCYYPGGGFINMIGFGNRLQVPDGEELAAILDNYARSPKSSIIKIEDIGRKIYINLDNLQHFRYALKGMTLCFYGHTLTISNLEAIVKVLKAIGEEEVNVGKSSHRDSPVRSANNAGSGNPHAE